jgi:hypothetical protein
MKDSKQIWVWVGVAVVVIVVVFAFVWKLKPKPVASGPVPVFAPQGQLTPNFPKDLILDNNAAISGSYSINYSSSTNQYTAEYDSSNTLVSLYNSYKTYFGANGWMVTNSSSIKSASKIGILIAATSSANVNVTLIAKGKGSEATISYVAH